MGLMFMYDAYQARHSQEDFDVFSIDDVDGMLNPCHSLITHNTAAFSAITPVKFSQVIYLTGKGKGITVSALSAGHLIGGSVWRIEKGLWRFDRELLMVPQTQRKYCTPVTTTTRKSDTWMAPY